jgi:protein subunit release factor A
MMNDMKEIHLTKNDFSIDWFSGSGAGGQHRNKHQNCCRITHIETGLTGVGQNSRSRVENQEEAFRILVRKLLVALDQNPEKPRNWSSDVVRTYHFERSIVTDGEVSSSVQSVLNGDLDAFLTHALRHGRKERKTGRV